MTLEHVAIWTDDLEAMKNYYTKYFHGEANAIYRNTTTGFESYFLKFESGARLELMKRFDIPENLNDTVHKQHLGIIHISFGVETMEEVDSKAVQLQNDGYKILRGPRKTGDGYYEFETLDPENNRLEVTTPYTDTNADTAKTKSNVQQAVPFFAVADMQRSLGFYVDALGFEMTHKWIDEGKVRWCWLRTGGAAVMLHEFRREGHDAWVPEGEVGIGVSIYLICEDALAIYRRAKSKNLLVKPPYVGNGMWVTELSDPDGYKLLYESVTSEPEDSVYSE